MNGESRPRGAAPESKAGGPDSTDCTPAQPFALFTPPERLEAARRARDDGAQAAELSMATAWRLAAEAALDELIATGLPFTAEDVYAKVGEPLGGHRNGIGGLFLRAAKRGRIVQAGVTTAKRPEARARLLRVWRAAP